MLTPISEVPVGSWFEYRGVRFIKTEPFRLCPTTSCGLVYQATSLVDGKAAFMMRTHTHHNADVGTELVEVVPKLDWAISTTGRLRFTTAAARSSAFEKLLQQFASGGGFDFTEDGPYFIIDYQTTEERHLRIQSLFGAG